MVLVLIRNDLSDTGVNGGGVFTETRFFGKKSIITSSDDTRGVPGGLNSNANYTDHSLLILEPPHLHQYCTQGSIWGVFLPEIEFFEKIQHCKL